MYVLFFKHFWKSLLLKIFFFHGSIQKLIFRLFANIQLNFFIFIRKFLLLSQIHLTFSWHTSWYFCFLSRLNFNTINLDFHFLFLFVLFDDNTHFLLNLNQLFGVLDPHLSSWILIDQTLNLTYGSITQFNCEIPFRFWTFQVCNLSILIIEVDRLKGSIDHFLIGVVKLFQIDLVEPYQFTLPPELNYYLLPWPISRRSIVRKYVHMPSSMKLWYSELNSFLCQRNFVPTRFTYFTKVTQTEINLHYFNRLLVL